MEANKILSSDILDLLFEHRNKEYGAYALRRTYNKRITTALLITGAICLLAVGGSLLASSLKKKSTKVEGSEITLQDVKQEEKKAVEPPPPPPPPKVEPPKVETEKFTPPKIVKDEEVKEQPPKQEDLIDKKIDEFKQEGIKDDGVAIKEEIKKEVIEEKKVEDEDKVFQKVEVEAAYDGDWKRFLEKNLSGDVATENGAPTGNYTVVVQFIVDKEGNVSDVQATTNHGYGMEAEAVRVIKKAPKWKPAQQNGRTVKAYRRQPITFQVVEE
jgi:periplasmic protein TonB